MFNCIEKKPDELQQIKAIFFAPIYLIYRLNFAAIQLAHYILSIK